MLMEPICVIHSSRQIGAGLGKSIRGFKKAMSDKEEPKEEAKSETKAIEQKDEKKG